MKTIQRSNDFSTVNFYLNYILCYILIIFYIHYLKLVLEQMASVFYFRNRFKEVKMNIKLSG